MYNRKLNINYTSGYKGVYYNKTLKRYIAYITINKKMKIIGSYKEKTQAVLSRMKRSKELYGCYINDCEKL